MSQAGRRTASALTLLGALSVVALLALVVHSGNASPLLPSTLAAAFLVAGALGAQARPDHRGLQLLLAVGTAHLAGYALTGWVGSIAHPAGWGPWLVAVLGDAFYLAGFVALALLVATYPTRLRDRVEALGGAFRLVAVPDVGTTVVSEFPVDRATVLHG